MKRTLSIGSRVTPPAVISTRTPPSRPGSASGAAARTVGGRGSPACSAGVPSAIARSAAASSSAGSARRPHPLLPLDASRPTPGSTILAPRRRSVARFSCTAGCSYIRLFIAGAITSGHSAASAQLVRRLSARPAASLAIVFAEAGAITNTSALAISSRWLIGSCSGSGWSGKAPRIGSRANSLQSAGPPLSAANDAAPTKRRLVGVCTTRTEWPAP